MLHLFLRIDPAWLHLLAVVVPPFLFLLLAPGMIRKLRALKAGQPVREAHDDVHAPAHAAKAGTPTMGGILIVGSLLLYALLFLPLDNVYLQCVLLVTAVTAFLGFLDDFAKIKKRSSDGVNAWFKIALQTSAAAAAAVYLYVSDPAITAVLVPFYGSVDLGWLFIPLAILTIIATSNAVNLTDGLDGLASGCMIPAALFFAVIDPLFHPVALSGFSLAIASACAAFLWFNCHPAKVFMGDTGSLALGGALGTLAVCTRMEFVLIILAGVFVAEAASVLLQVLWFKLSRRLYGAGRRLFRMAPLHHHFEMCGVRESQVCVRFWLIAWLLFFVAFLVADFLIL